MTSPASTHERLVIIGAGPAGYTAAIYSARAMLKPLLLAGFEPGGQLMITTDVENYPGFAEADPGPLADGADAPAGRARRRAARKRACRSRSICRAGRSASSATAGGWCSPNALILATGAKAKWLGLPSEQHWQGFGVSACATCDGFFFRGKRVVVVGGGNSAVEEALYLSQLAASRHGRPSPRPVPRRAHPDRAARRAAERELQVEPHGRGDRRRRNRRAASPACG